MGILKKQWLSVTLLYLQYQLLNLPLKLFVFVTPYIDGLVVAGGKSHLGLWSKGRAFAFDRDSIDG